MLAKKFCIMIVLLIPLISLNADPALVEPALAEPALNVESAENSDGCITITAVPFTFNHYILHQKMEF